MLRISARVRESPGDIVVKDIKGIPLLRPRPLKYLKAYNRKLSKKRKTHLKAHILIIRTKGIRPYIVGLIIRLKDLFIRLLIFRGCVGKVI